MEGAVLHQGPGSVSRLDDVACDATDGFLQPLAFLSGTVGAPSFVDGRQSEFVRVDGGIPVIVGLIRGVGVIGVVVVVVIAVGVVVVVVAVGVVVVVVAVGVMVVGRVVVTGSRCVVIGVVASCSAFSTAAAPAALSVATGGAVPSVREPVRLCRTARGSV